ncbi:hypothetical protein ACFWY6_06490 [Streptomyces sp. NPDC059037]|uniref:hypothetical protein n=1 Tax=Streptomyces sp. NPDC059037 TaxID=3346710 RepID=UPI0036BD1B6F
MSSGAVAILIASLSAVFTGFNMIASWATYRRTRPRVEILLRMDHHKSAAENRVNFSMLIRNHGQYPVTLDSFGSLCVQPLEEVSHSKWYRYKHWRSQYRLWRNPVDVREFPMSRGARGAVFQHETEQPVEVIPFNGTEWLVRLDTKYTTALQHGRGPWQARVLLYMSLGKPVFSPWAYCNLDLPMNGEQEVEGSKVNQLSFDDLEEGQ